MTSRVALRDQPLIPDGLVIALSTDADSRRIDAGTERVAGCAGILQSFKPAAKNATTFLTVLARWCDVGDGGVEPIEKLLATYDPAVRLQLSVSDYVRVRMAEGVVAMKREMLDRAIEDFEIVLKLADETSATDVVALSNYWIGRCYRKKGNYERALLHVRRGRELQMSCGHLQCAAAMRVLEGLTLFDQGEPKRALEHLREAEAVLIRTDDYVALGNIQSTYGRILQREGRYKQAIEHYSKAVELFTKRDSKDSNVARAEVDVSFTRIQVVRSLRRNIDVYADQHEKSGFRPARAVLVKELSTLYEAVLADLNRAGLIYDRFPNARGLARVHLYRGYLHHVVGELDLATQEATRAYVAAEAKGDIILMASARNLQCMVEEAMVEEEIEGCAEHALAAQDYAREAVELANRTQNPRLLAKVHTWYGLTLSNAILNQRERAREEMELAATYLEPEVRDEIWEDYQVLRKRLLENNSLDAKLMQWAHGETVEKTFRQLEEDFADLVIPMAWRQEGRKISRVATRFSISPRKVRRVLARLGFLEGETEEASKELPAKRLTREPGGTLRPILISTTTCPAPAIRRRANEVPSKRSHRRKA
jgi:hypothetical protein